MEGLTKRNLRQHQIYVCPEGCRVKLPGTKIIDGRRCCKEHNAWILHKVSWCLDCGKEIQLVLRSRAIRCRECAKEAVRKTAREFNKTPAGKRRLEGLRVVNNPKKEKNNQRKSKAYRTMKKVEDIFDNLYSRHVPGVKI